MISPIKRDNISPSTYSKNEDNCLCQKIPSISEYTEETSNIVLNEKTFDTEHNFLFKRYNKLNTIKEEFEEKIGYDNMSVNTMKINIKSEFLMSYKSFEHNESQEEIIENKEDERDKTPMYYIS